ncbi:DUF3793 family protein [Clostridium cylindrosporum]|uniref:DUF3793 domain-containing protein n=1 Tax=Clostridium cylindrosporum DSM 605 TaxID=1121307 RepID=A0A0J8D6P8_CLOCY|nr:DUF3793 family protein [Clostridium cylindrosporum]KMT21760.1 hypothetical protein CLCY_3c00270 [Clostridium cylindrosporum DSM 605]
MKTIDFYNKLNSMHEKDYIENFLTYSTSLVIAGIKPAVTIALSEQNKKLFKSWKHFGRDFVDKLSLNYIELRNTSKSTILMIYDKDVLQKRLTKESVQQFLIELGYPKTLDIHSYINKLKLRYEKYHCPHELGLFLGIPIEDVKDFMNCTPKECLLCGYWKVYNNLHEAKNTFDKYDMIKEYTIQSILQGKLSHDVAFKIKNYSFSLSNVN